MVDEQLRSRDIQDPRVLAALEAVPRNRFVPEGLLGAAYDDRALPIDEQQTISQPYTVAFMCQAAQLRGHERVLEIGTGSGYGAAVLSHLAQHVFTVERIPALAEAAKQRLAAYGYDNTTVLSGDGSLGLPDQAPFDAIVVTAGADRFPAALGDQLAEGGRLVLPVGPRVSQTMWRYTRRGADLHGEPLGEFVFVPLLPGVKA